MLPVRGYLLSSASRVAMSDQGESGPIVYIVDDDANVRDGLQDLLQSVGLQSKSFSSTTALLKGKLADQVSCLILDVRLRGLSGLDFQAEMAKQQIKVPIIFITGHADVLMSVKAMKAGAVEFLTKPIREQDLLDAVRVALERDRARRNLESQTQSLRSRYDALSERERQVMSLVVSGMLNKQIAGQLGTAESTVKVQRSRAMEKMHAESLVDLVRMIEKIKGPSEK